jgi:hypothetical protein
MKEIIQKNRENKPKVHSQLFLECVEALTSDCRILSDEESELVYDELQDKFNFSWWGRIDWDSVDDKKIVSDASEIIPTLQAMAEISWPVFILWGYDDEPVIQTTIGNIVRSIDDVKAVGCDQWIYIREGGYVVELFHDDVITIGFAK